MADVMESTVDFVDPAPVQGRKPNIMAYAEKVAKALKYEPGSNLVPLVKSLNGEVCYRDDFEFEDDVSGAIEVFSPKKFVIYLPEFSTSVNRDRFTIAHELGHFFLHSRMGEIAIRVNRETKTSSLLEWQANWFAGAFLMPSNLVNELLPLGLSFSADYFRVSEMAMQVRWKSLGLNA